MSVIFLQNRYPELEFAFNAIQGIELPKRSSWSVEKSIIKIICGQMLSRPVASTIFNRLMEASQDDAHACLKLSTQSLTECGLSKQKVRTLREVQKHSEICIGLEHWKEFSYTELCKEVKSIWGLSQWSSDMLAIFYFGHEDVYPSGDGTLKKAEKIINEKIYQNKIFEPQKAHPYRTLLSIYMWAFIDQKILNDDLI